MNCLVAHFRPRLIRKKAIRHIVWVASIYNNISQKKKPQLSRLVSGIYAYARDAIRHHRMSSLLASSGQQTPSTARSTATTDVFACTYLYSKRIVRELHFLLYAAETEQNRQCVVCVLDIIYIYCTKDWFTLANKKWTDGIDNPKAQITQASELREQREWFHMRHLI